MPYSDEFLRSPSGSAAISAEVNGAGAPFRSVADYNARAATPGVTAAYTFTDNTYFANPAYVHPDANANHVVRNPTGGPTGRGCLRLNIFTTDGAGNGAWHGPFNPAWTLPSQGFGTTGFYVQFSFRVGPGFFADNPGADPSISSKLANYGGYIPANPSASVSHPGHEEVLQFQYKSKALYPYRECANATPPGQAAELYLQDSSPDPGDFRFQNAYVNPAGTGKYDTYCLYQPGAPYNVSAGCYRFEEGRWYTLMTYVETATPGGSTGNKYKMWVAKDTDTAWTMLYDMNNVSRGFDNTFAGGTNSFWALGGYSTNAPGRGADSYVEYDEILVGTSMFACPQPGGALAALAATMSPNSWAQLTVTGQNAALGAGDNDGSQLPWQNTMPFNPVNQSIEIIGRDHHYTSAIYGADGANRYSRFTLATNSWAFIADLPEVKDGHGGDTLTINPFNGDLYWRLYSAFTGNISAMKKPMAASNFSNIPSVSGLEQVAIGTTWWSGSFVGGGAQGSFMIFNSGNSVAGANDGQIVAYNPLTNNWFFNQVAMAPFYGAGSTYNSVIEYDSVKNVAVYGGGNPAPTKLWRVNSSGVAQAMPDTPGTTIVGLQRGILVNAPTTGGFLLLSQGELWWLNPDGSGSWTQKATPPGAVGNPTAPHNMCAVAIPDYGVVAVITQHNQGNGNFYLYKPG